MASAICQTLRKTWHTKRFAGMVGEVEMRDPKRIDEFCRMLAYYWHRVPDWRFGQLISNVLGEYVAQTHRDIFFPEDDELLDFFRQYFSMEGSSPYVSGNEEKK